MPAGPSGVGQQWREPLDPAVDADVVDLDTTVGEEFLDVAVGQAEARYQRTATTMTSGGKRNPRRRTAELEYGEGGGFSCPWGAETLIWPLSCWFA